MNFVGYDYKKERQAEADLDLEDGLDDFVIQNED